MGALHGSRDALGPKVVEVVVLLLLLPLADWVWEVAVASAAAPQAAWNCERGVART